MSGGLNRLFVAALVAGAVLLAPSAALACNGGPSAENVYKECLPTGGTGNSGGGNSTSGPSSSSTPVSSQAKAAISKAPAKDRRTLYTLVKHGPSRLEMDKTGPTSAATASPSAIGSAFDLGSGPTALLVVLAAAAFLLLAGTTVRGVRQRRR